MTDRELLERAAKAAGIEIYFDEDGSCHTYVAIHVDSYVSRPWNPLNDDGDAFRLAVKLGICIDIDLPDQQTWAIDVSRNRSPIEPHGGDACAATRLAIVRAAAAMQEEG